MISEGVCSFFRLISIPVVSALHNLNARDATTNPRLILEACKKPQYQRLIDEAVQYGQSHAK